MPDIHSTSHASCTPTQARQHKTGCADHCSAKSNAHTARSLIVIGTSSPAAARRRPLLGQHLAAKLGSNVLIQRSGVRNVLAACSCLMCAATGTSHQAIGNKQPDHNINRSHWRACRSMGLLSQPLDLRPFGKPGPNANSSVTICDQKRPLYSALEVPTSCTGQHQLAPAEAQPCSRPMPAKNACQKSATAANKRGLMEGCQVVIAALQHGLAWSACLPHAPTSAPYFSSNAQRHACICCNSTGAMLCHAASN